MNGTEFARVGGSYNTAFIGTYQVLSQSTSGNYTTFRLYGYFYYGGGTQVSSQTSGGFYLDGTYIYGASYTFGPGYHLLGTKDITVGHNNDGSYPGRYVGISAQSWHMSGSSGGNIYAGNIARYANITNAPSSLTDEGSFWFSYSNPANASMSCWLEINPTGEHLCTRTLSGTSGTYTWELTETERNQLRGKLPNSNSGNCRIGLYSTIGGSTNASYVDKTFTIVNANPTFSNFTFEDTNTTTLALTGNNQNIIQGYSNVKATIPTNYIATANKQATMSKYSFVCSDVQKDITYSSSEATNNTIDGVKSGVFNVYAIDSRNNSTLITKNATQTIAYNPLLKGDISINRQNGVAEETTLVLSGVADLVNFGQVTNSIQEAKFRYKATDSATWSNYTNITLTVDNNGNFTFNGLIRGDTNSGFDIGNAYNIEVYVADELSNVTFTANLGSGTPGIAIHKQGVSIMSKYDTTEGGALQIEGKNIFKYSTSEVKTGYKWIDGKPIYRKIFTGNMTNTTNSWVNLQQCNLTNADSILDIKGTITNTSSDKRVLLINSFENSSYHCAFSYLGQTDYLQCNVSGWTYSNFGFKYIVAIYYTKTTD